MFRVLAGVSSPFFLVAALGTGFPRLFGSNENPNLILTVLLLWGGILFASIAAKGRPRIRNE